MTTVLVTGASGFIGSEFIRQTLFTHPTMRIVAFARNTTQKNFQRLKNVTGRTLHQLNLRLGDLNDDISGLCEGVDYVVNFAAKTFVDHSIRDPIPFLEANTLGSLRLLEDAKRHKVKRFIQISTDEVYGSILKGAYSEDAPLNPSNPYSASKAGADAWAIAYAHTYGLHTTVTRTENNYGPYQHPQKAMPVFVKKAMLGEPLPVYGDGLHVRQWLHVSDHVSAVWKLLESDIPPGGIYHVAGSQETTNIELAKRILKLCGRSEDLIGFIPDHDIRPGHDRRYALSCEKLRALGWEPKINLDEGLASVVAWYQDNQWWLE